jgi:hypothetical protein
MRIPRRRRERNRSVDDSADRRDRALDLLGFLNFDQS